MSNVFFGGVKEFETLFENFLCSQFEPAGFRRTSDKSSVIEQLRAWMQTLPAGSLVLLIDEYDAPLTACLDKPELFTEIQQKLAGFYRMVNSQSACLRFFFMTGITKLGNTDIFTSFEGLNDISLQPAFGTIVGFTEEEILENFAPHLERAAQVLGLEKTVLLEKLRKNYGGYCFDCTGSKRVLSTWSVLNFLRNPGAGFKNYWYLTGGHPCHSLKCFKDRPLVDPLAYFELRQLSFEKLSASRPYDGLDENVILTQAGYLTIRQISADGNAVLGYPNNEVASSLARVSASELMAGRLHFPKENVALTEFLTHRGFESIVERLNEVFKLVDFERFPVVDAASCRLNLHLLLIGADMVPYSDVHAGPESTDLEVDAGDRHWVFELMFAGENEDPEKKLAQGIEQVKKNRYGEGLHGGKLLRAVLVFSGSERRFVAWKAVDGDACA